MKRTYEELYAEGEKQFCKWIEKRDIDYWHLTDWDCDELFEPWAWRAYYNDNYKIPSLEFGYFIICEYYKDEDMAKEFYDDYMKYYTHEELNAELKRCWYKDFWDVA